MNRLLIITCLIAAGAAYSEDVRKQAMLSTSAFAEDAPKPPDTPPAPIAAPTEWYLRFDQPNLNVLSACIQELKKKDADPFLATIQAQIGKQAEIVAAIKAK